MKGHTEWQEKMATHGEGSGICFIIFKSFTIRIRCRATYNISIVKDTAWIVCCLCIIILNPKAMDFHLSQTISTLYQSKIKVCVRQFLV